MRKTALLVVLSLSLATASLAYPDPGNTGGCSGAWTTYGSWQPIYDSLGSLIGYRRRATSYEEYANGSGTCGVRMVDSWWENR